jgi:hypothetical protein
MSDNDLIMRGDARKMKFAGYLINEGGIFVSVHEVVDNIKAIPAVKQPMSAREFVVAHHRMCQSMECVKCRICHDDGEPRSCAVLMGLNPDDTVAIVEQWAQEHPERSEEDGDV